MNFRHLLSCDTIVQLRRLNLLVCDRSVSVNVITHTFVGLKCLTETKIQILCDHVSHTRLHTEMGCQMVQLLSAHIVGPTMCVNLTLAFPLHIKFKAHGSSVMEFPGWVPVPVPVPIDG